MVSCQPCAQDPCDGMSNSAWEGPLVHAHINSAVDHEAARKDTRTADVMSLLRPYCPSRFFRTGPTTALIRAYML